MWLTFSVIRRIDIKNTCTSEYEPRGYGFESTGKIVMILSRVARSIDDSRKNFKNFFITQN